jgi:hypothetical protein
MFIILMGVVVSYSNITASTCPTECDCTGKSNIGCL